MGDYLPFLSALQMRESMPPLTRLRPPTNAYTPSPLVISKNGGRCDPHREGLPYNLRYVLPSPSMDSGGRTVSVLRGEQEIPGESHRSTQPTMVSVVSVARQNMKRPKYSEFEDGKAQEKAEDGQKSRACAYRYAHIYFEEEVHIFSSAQGRTIRCPRWTVVQARGFNVSTRRPQIG